MPSAKEIEAVTRVISSRCSGACVDTECVHMVPPPEGNCECATIALIALEAAERARAETSNP